MTVTRIAMAAGMLLLLAFVVIIALVADSAALTVVLAFVALAVLIGGGNAIYGRNSHYAKAHARTAPAQAARNRAIDEARAARADPPEPSQP
jgi:hypothetical protein